MTELGPVAGRFRRFGEQEAAQSSPLYGALSLDIADDEEVLSILLAAWNRIRHGR